MSDKRFVVEPIKLDNDHPNFPDLEGWRIRDTVRGFIRPAIYLKEILANEQADKLNSDLWDGEPFFESKYRRNKDNSPIMIGADS